MDMNDLLARMLAEKLEGPGEAWERDLHDDADTAEIEHLAALADRLRRTPHPVVSDAFRRNARIRILNQIRTGNVNAAPVVQPADFKMRLTMLLRNVLFATAILVGFLFFGEVVSYSAKTALPGDLLYPAKLGLENVQDLIASNEQEVILQTRFASNRLAEIQILIAEERYEEIDAAVEAFEHHIDRAVTALAAVAREDGSATYPILVRMEKDLQFYSQTLSDLRTFVPEPTRAALSRAITASQSLSLHLD